MKKYIVSRRVIQKGIGYYWSDNHTFYKNVSVNGDYVEFDINTRHYKLPIKKTKYGMAFDLYNRMYVKEVEE